VQCFSSIIPDNLNAAPLAEVEKVLTSIPLGNWVHKDNNLLPKHSNTMTVQTAEPEPDTVAEPEPERVAHIPDTDMSKDNDMDKPSHKQWLHLSTLEQSNHLPIRHLAPSHGQRKLE
jgi:hypothetical protein